MPTGTFDCYRIEGKGISRPIHGSGSTTLLNNYWMAPTLCRRPIRSETERIAYNQRGRQDLQNERFEMESFKQG